MKIDLLLSLHYMPDNEGLLIFRNNKDRIEMSRLTNSLQFLGNMQQLSQAIIQEGKQDCTYELTSFKGLQWVLDCTYKKGVVALDVWLQQFGFQDQLDTIFSWQGKAMEFRDSVALIIKNAGKYKYFAKG
jgi:hypothetical protein